MDIHEYQAKELLERYSLPVPRFWVASSAEEARQIMRSFGLQKAVLKIQVHAGGRGKAGGVKLVSQEEVLETAKQLFCLKMVNSQTGPQGIIANKILVTKALDIEKEYYLAATIDRERARPVLIASQEGGMDIEEVARAYPEKICKVPIELSGLIRPFHVMRVMKCLGLEGHLVEEASLIVQSLAKFFVDKDATLLEINPLVLSKGHLFILDAKMSFDDDALFRQPEIALLCDASQLSPIEQEAKKQGLSYVAMEGEIGCMVNGAGLAMATMDLIDHYGGAPANFLDVGGGASKEKVSAGLQLILQDEKVKAILVNIFGGIMDCAILAEGIIAAAKECRILVPLVVRLEGTNVERGRALLRDSGLVLLQASSLQEAAEKAVAAART